MEEAGAGFSSRRSAKEAMVQSWAALVEAKADTGATAGALAKIGAATAAGILFLLSFCCLFEFFVCSNGRCSEMFNVTNRLVVLFSRIDVDPADGFVTEHELIQWNLQ